MSNEYDMIFKIFVYVHDLLGLHKLARKGQPH